MSKIKTIKLTPWPNPNTSNGLPRRYRVEQITNSLAYEPERFIDHKEVESLCASSTWKVTVVARPVV